MGLGKNRIQPVADRTADSKLGTPELQHRFGTHKATIEGPEATLPKHRDLRIMFLNFAEYLDEEAPNSREKSLALTALEEASMWMHKAIAKTAPLVEE